MCKTTFITFHYVLHYFHFPPYFDLVRLFSLLLLYIKHSFSLLFISLFISLYFIFFLIDFTHIVIVTLHPFMILITSWELQVCTQHAKFWMIPKWCVQLADQQDSMNQCGSWWHRLLMRIHQYCLCSASPIIHRQTMLLDWAQHKPNRKTTISPAMKKQHIEQSSHDEMRSKFILHGLFVDALMHVSWCLYLRVMGLANRSWKSTPQTSRLMEPSSWLPLWSLNWSWIKGLSIPLHPQDASRVQGPFCNRNCQTIGKQSFQLINLWQFQVDVVQQGSDHVEIKIHAVAEYYV